jgi:hypothetical protein
MFFDATRFKVWLFSIRKCNIGTSRLAIFFYLFYLLFVLQRVAVTNQCYFDQGADAINKPSRVGKSIFRITSLQFVWVWLLV